MHPDQITTNSSLNYNQSKKSKVTLYGDATAIAVNEHRTWMDAKNGLYSRRDCRKLHIVTAKNGIIVSYKTTHHDATSF